MCFRTQERKLRRGEILLSWKGFSMYISDLTELLYLLHQTEKSWIVHIESPETELEGVRAQWQARLAFIEGVVTTCHIWSGEDTHRLFSDNAGLEWLAAQPHLAWKLELLNSQQKSPAVFQDVRASTSQQIPRRTVQVDMNLMSIWPLRQRQVFLLVDGSRTIEQIAMILRQPSDAIEQILNELQWMQVIQK